MGHCILWPPKTIVEVMGIIIIIVKLQYFHVATPIVIMVLEFSGLCIKS